MRLQDPGHRTQIVATLGPATQTTSRIKALVGLGVDIVRNNASHGTAADHARRIRITRRVARTLRKKVSILLDLPGPKYRLGTVPGGSLVLKFGQTVRLTAARPPSPNTPWLPLRQPEVLAHLKPGHVLFLNDGLVELEVLRVLKGVARCRIAAEGVVRSGSGINIPHTDLKVALPTPADRDWIRFAALHKADWLAVSFVQTAEDIRRVRQAAQDCNYKPRIMAKIEKRKGMENLDSIIRESDGVMVARGDLGVETPLAEIPFAQKRIIAAANRRKKFVVTATQMLESMVSQPMPTRAEVTDIANAVIDGTDAVMLSAETAIGQYPLEAVSVLSRVLSAAEHHQVKR